MIDIVYNEREKWQVLQGNVLVGVGHQGHQGKANVFNSIIIENYIEKGIPLQGIIGFQLIIS